MTKYVIHEAFSLRRRASTRVSTRHARVRAPLKALWIAMAAAQVLAGGSGRVVRLAPEFDEIAAPGTEIEKVAGGFTFIEGPVWLHDGFLLFSDVRANRIMRWSPGGGASVFREHSGIDADMPVGEPYGSNGLTIDRQGRLTMCQHGDRRVVRLEKDGTLTMLADRYQGKRLNSPNDLVYKSDGALYFTDPPYGLFPGYDQDPRKELPFSGIFRWADGKLECVYKDLPRPNGLAFSPDEKYLYVANSEPPKKLWMRFEVKKDGSLGEGKFFFDANEEKEEGLPDGLKVDRRGNVYCAGPGGIWIFSAAGKHIGSIQPTEMPANCAWGGGDGKDLYMTARTGLYRIRLKVKGIRPRGGRSLVACGFTNSDGHGLPATSSLGIQTYFESKSLARFCCDFLNLQHLAESAFSTSVAPNEAQTRHMFTPNSCVTMRPLLEHMKTLLPEVPGAEIFVLHGPLGRTRLELSSRPRGRALRPPDGGFHRRCFAAAALGAPRRDEQRKPWESFGPKWER